MSSYKDYKTAKNKVKFDMLTIDDFEENLIENILDYLQKYRDTRNIDYLKESQKYLCKLLNTREWRDKDEQKE